MCHPGLQQSLSSLHWPSALHSPPHLHATALLHQEGYSLDSNGRPQQERPLHRLHEETIQQGSCSCVEKGIIRGISEGVVDLSEITEVKVYTWEELALIDANDAVGVRSILSLAEPVC